MRKPHVPSPPGTSVSPSFVSTRRQASPDTNMCFDEAVSDLWPHLVRYASTIVGAVVAEDIAQESLLRAWRYFASYDGKGSFRAWILRICRRCAIDYFERETRERKKTEAAATLAMTASVERHIPQNALHVELLISSLPSEEREVFVLTQIVGVSYQETAEIVAIPIGTVRSRIARARRRLVAQLKAAEVS